MMQVLERGKRMTYETLKRSHVKRNIVIALIVVGVISAIVLNFTRAKYRTTQSMPLLNGTINYTLADLNIVAMYVDGSEVDTFPDGNYELTEESYCSNEDNERDEAITLNYDSATKGLSVSPMTKKGTKCYLYFEEGASGGDYILAGDNAPTSHTTDWTGKESYYYTENPDNWVSFAGFYWRIIRINGDGSIRMIYQGTSANTTGSGTQAGTSAFNSSPNNNMYVGYMYGSSSSDYNTTHANINPSTIKGILDTWYHNNLEINYGQYIDGNAGFCGDRRVSSGTGTGTTYTNYQPYTRISNSSPSLSCETPDIYTTKGSSTGNGALTYPIGLISADEAMLAGIPNGNSGNQNNYLYTGQIYWTMSPYYFHFTYGGAGVFNVSSSGYLSSDWVDNARGVRPVINLKSAIAITGDGSVDKPFKVQ